MVNDLRIIGNYFSSSLKDKLVAYREILRKILLKTKYHIFVYHQILLRFIFGPTVQKLEKNYILKFSNIPMITILHPKRYAAIWSFINSACFNYAEYKNIKSLFEDSEKKTSFFKFLEKYELVYLKEINDNDEKIIIYGNFFHDNVNSKDLSQKIFEISKELKYPSFVLYIINHYSSMLKTYGDYNLEMIPNEKDRLELMNVDFNKFILTEEQLKIFIEALQLELINAENQVFYYRDSIESLIKNLKKVLIKNKFKNLFFKFKNNLAFIFYILSPLFFYSLFTILFKILPFFLIYLFVLFLIYYCIKFLIPFFQKKEFFGGIFQLLKKIFYFIWSQKIIFFLIIFLPNFAFFSSLFSCFKNSLNFIPSVKFNFMLPGVVNRVKKQKYQTIFDICSSLNLVVNPVLTEKNLSKNGNFPFLDNKNLSGSLIYRSWYRSPIYFKKFYGNAIDWCSRYHNLNRFETHKKIAKIQSEIINNFGENSNFLDLEKILLNDMGHKNFIRGDESMVAILVSQQLNTPIFHHGKNINNHAIDFKIILSSGDEFFFEVKPGYELCKISNKPKLFLEKVSKYLQIERVNTQIENIGIVFDCSDGSFETMLKCRQIIFENNLSKFVLFTHKFEGLAIKEVISTNQFILTQSDYHLRYIHSNISEQTFKQLNQEHGPSIDSQTNDNFIKISNSIEKEYSQESSNNGYDVLRKWYFR